MAEPEQTGSTRAARRLRVWVVRDYEPLPTDEGRRLMRAGMLSLALAAAGHETTWFTSTFDHYLKRQRAERDEETVVSPTLTIKAFHARAYRRNISLDRIIHNRQFARRFRDFAENASPPDIVVTDIPTTEAALEAVRYASSRGIPSVVSIRDLWPDFFVDFIPAALRPLARPFISRLDRQVREACRDASALVGVSPDYLAWGQRKGGRINTAEDAVFPLGYPAIAPSGDASFWRKQGTFRVSFVGSWGATYDLDLLLQTARLCQSRRDIEFFVAGNSEARPALREAFQALPNVRLTGWLNEQQIADLLSNSDIGLLPYVTDAPQGLPNKCYEYMAYGAYQLATLRGEIEQFYAETGAGEAVGGTAAALAAAIVDWVDRRAGSDNRQERVNTFNARFSSSAIYQAMVRHIEHVAG